MQALQEESIEESFVGKNKPKKGRGKVYRNIHLGLVKQLQETELILAHEDSDVPIYSSPSCGEEAPKENSPEVVVLSRLDIRKWNRYKGKFTKNMKPILKDFVFHMRALRIWKDEKKTVEWHQSYGNVYFHFNISCVQKHNSHINVEDITIDEDTFTLLTS